MGAARRHEPRSGRGFVAPLSDLLLERSLEVSTGPSPLLSGPLQKCEMRTRSGTPRANLTHGLRASSSASAAVEDSLQFAHGGASLPARLLGPRHDAYIAPGSSQRCGMPHYVARDQEERGLSFQGKQRLPSLSSRREINASSRRHVRDANAAGQNRTEQDSIAKTGFLVIAEGLWSTAARSETQGAFEAFGQQLRHHSSAPTSPHHTHRHLLHPRFSTATQIHVTISHVIISSSNSRRSSSGSLEQLWRVGRFSRRR